MRSYKDKEGRREGIRAIGKQAQRNGVGIRDVLRCQTGGHEGTEVMVGRRVETDEQRAKHHREESRKEKQSEKKGQRRAGDYQTSNKEQKMTDTTLVQGELEREWGDPQKRWPNTD